ncbi:THEM117 domain containing protein [Euroglyphus maynei]|uniref:THEM117 domain containing protein n=1 Tax=Euroglyphus maynei TaxID=6958 RepID=A0A1Y3B649_EURMA|nr:THEM117 domain containing protein [Euroglyphus maynei]
MGITYALFMKIAACGTWCGDFFTAWMITDMMLQDNLYPNWAIGLRAFWYKHANIRIMDH